MQYEHTNDCEIASVSNAGSPTAYSASLHAPRVEEYYCPTCDAKAQTFLCAKCRDRYVCDHCAPEQVCDNCIVHCDICYTESICGDVFEELCEKCEQQLYEVDGYVESNNGIIFESLVDLLISGEPGHIITDNLIAEEIRTYLERNGVNIFEEHPNKNNSNSVQLQQHIE